MLQHCEGIGACSHFMYWQVGILGSSHAQLWQFAEMRCTIVQAHGDVGVNGMYDNSVNTFILDTVEGVEYYPCQPPPPVLCVEGVKPDNTCLLLITRQSLKQSDQLLSCLSCS